MLRVILTSIIAFIISQYMIAGKQGFWLRKKEYIFYNILSVFCLYSFFNAILWNYEINFLITITFVYIFSLAMYYVHEFRGTNFNFSDLSSINTATEVAGGYKYKVKAIFVLIALFIVGEYLLQIFVIKINIYGNYHKVINGIGGKNIDEYRFFWHELGQLLSFFISFFILRDKISLEYFDYSLFAGENEGYIYNFISSIPVFHKSKVSYEESAFAAKQFIFNVFNTLNSKNIKKITENTTSEMAKYKTYANTNVDAPHIIVIMNESFGSIHRRIETNELVTPYFDNLQGAIKGNLYVNTFGGGTANTEFEFLTGMTVGNYPYPVMPYNSFVKRNKYSIARFFNNLGYKTIAMHPYTATNYHRNKVYKYFGFEDIVFLKDFKSKKYVRKFVSDESMYEEVIRRYSMTKMQERKMFLFGVTIQNHSGYNDLKNGEILSHTRELDNRDELDAYLSLMKISDNALKKLIDYFKQEEQHVIVLFFGDHNASFGTKLNKIIYDNSIDYEHTNAYSVPFLIYDNKYPEERFVKQISANFLSLELIKKANLPYDMLHKLLFELYNNNAAYNYHKTKSRTDAKTTYIPIDKFMMLEKEYFR